MTRHRPQNVDPQREKTRIILIYKNFAASKGISHVGLGIACLNTARTLRARGFEVDVWPANTVADIRTRLEHAQHQACARGKHPVSHVVISAPWIATVDLQRLLTDYSDVEFAVTSHSNVGFLQADPNGIKLLRQEIALVDGHHNFTLAGNSQKFCDAWGAMYGAKVQYLPNLYDVSAIKHVGERVPWRHGHTLRVGIFGATRPLKNMVTATAAAIELGSAMRNDVEIWVSSGREEGGGTTKNAILQLVDGLPHVKLVEAGWRAWPDFRRIVGNMHVLLQPSYTESFNIVTADGISEGVATVVSEAIDWVPSDWIASVDDVGDVARCARRLLMDVHAVNDGQHALRRYVKHGTHAWEGWLLGGGE